MRRSGAIGIPSGDLLLYFFLIAVGMAFCEPILLHKKLLCLPPLAGAVTYFYITLPVILAFLLERRSWLPQWIRDCAETFLLLFGLPAVLAFLIALWKLRTLITLLL